MKYVQRPVYLALTLALVGGVLLLRGMVNDGDPATDAPADGRVVRAMRQPDTTAATGALPRLVEFGSDRCVPCRAMKPVLADLRTAHDGGLIVETVDVWKDHAAGTRAGIVSIPTQVFYGRDGREVFRHTGFISRADVEAKFAELGIDLRR